MKMELKRSEKYGCFYKVEDNTLYQCPDTKDWEDDWVEVSSFAFNEKERKEFDWHILGLFGRIIELNN